MKDIIVIAALGVGLVFGLLGGARYAEYNERDNWCSYTHTKRVEYTVCMKSPDWRSYR